MMVWMMGREEESAVIGDDSKLATI